MGLWAVPRELQQLLQAPWRASRALHGCSCGCLQSRLIALGETQEQYFTLVARRQEALGMSSYDEADLDCLSSEASERLHSLHEVGDEPPLSHSSTGGNMSPLANNPTDLLCTSTCNGCLPASRVCGACSGVGLSQQLATVLLQQPLELSDLGLEHRATSLSALQQQLRPCPLYLVGIT